MHPLSTVQPITQLLVQVHAVIEKIAGVNGPNERGNERDQRKSKQESIQVGCVPTAVVASTPMRGGTL